jgi:biopolymer transport protein ExbB
MHELNALLIAFQDFFSAGGDVLWLILAVTVLLWGLIIERFWFYARRYPRELNETLERWNERDDHRSWYAHRVREALISSLEIRLNSNVTVIKTLVAVLPLLGLLGTITGMIQVFDVLAVMGTGDPRAMANGVSAATIPTMAGMVTALSGLYFGVYLERRAKAETRLLADRMAIAGGLHHA